MKLGYDVHLECTRGLMGLWRDIRWHIILGEKDQHIHANTVP